MLKYLVTVFVFFLLIETAVLGQTETYTIKKSRVSSEKYDEFSPVYYKGGIVFCSNQNSNLIFNYSTSQNKALFKIYYIDTIAADWRNATLFSTALVTRFNDGPVTFNSSGDTIYYSRNLVVDGNQKDALSQRNRLGLFCAVLEGTKWTNIQELRFNSDSYNITTPYLSPDGKRLYFASDKPDGYGGSDLYYCQWNKDYWNNPVNLGPEINTSGNEAYPFVNQAGELFFSSDGHPGLGGKDIFFSKFVNNAWILPVRLDAPINSSGNDFGYIADGSMSSGYFTSDREKSLDIYSFKTNSPQFFYCENQRTIRYCFSFPDDIGIDIDPLNLQFQWDFGDGKKETGYVVEHCFPGPGKYSVKQNIIDKKSGKVVFNKIFYYLEIRDIVQPFITAAEVVVAGSPVSFDAMKSHLPGYGILLYSWDFGDGGLANGEVVKHTFKEKGEYLVKLAVNLKENSSGENHQICVSRKITVTSDVAELNLLKGKAVKVKEALSKVTDYDHVFIDTRYSSFEAMSQKAIFQVEILTSRTKTSLTNPIFANIIPKYAVKEIFLTDDKLYAYIIDEGTSFMDVYPAFRDAMSLSYNNARIKTYIPADPAEKELWSFKRAYGTSADKFFSNNDSRLLPEGLPILDQLLIFLKKNPKIRLEITTHTDNTGLPAVNLVLSRNRAQSIVSYLVSKGITSSRLVSSGYGATRPIASNYSEADRKKNRRIDFIKINE